MSQPTPATAALVAAPVARRPSPGQQCALAAVAATEGAGRDKEADEEDDVGIDRPQQVAGSGMQLVTFCCLEGGLFGPAPGSGHGAEKGGGWVRYSEAIAG